MGMILAKLVTGQDYYLLGAKFIVGKEVEIDENLKSHLVGNSQFEITEVEESPKENNEKKEELQGPEKLEEPEEVEESPKQKGMVLKGRGAKRKQEGDK